MQQTKQALDKAEELLALFGLTGSRPEEFRIDAIVPASLLPDVVRHICESRWGYLSAITGIDLPGTETHEAKDRQFRQQPHEGTSMETDKDGAIEVLYHFCNGAAVLSLRTTLSYTNPTINSISQMIPGALLYEQELAEMLGVRVKGSPRLKEHLLLPETWPKNVYPLRKSFKGLKETNKE